MLWLTRHRLVALALICAVCTGAVIAAAMFRSLPFADSVWSNEITFHDALARKARRTALHPDFVFLGIDEASKKLVCEVRAKNDPIAILLQHCGELLVARPIAIEHQVEHDQARAGIAEPLDQLSVHIA